MEHIKKYKEDKIFYFATIILLSFFLFKLINQSQIMGQFPLDGNNDISAHLGQLHFLKEYGFHKNVPNWFNGYTLFLNYPIAWYFLTLPLYIFLGNILLSTFISHILLFIICFALFLILGKIARISIAKTAFLYLILFASPVAVGNLIKLGRVTELTGILFFISFFTLLLYFKDKPFGFKGMLIFALLYAALILSHPSWTIFASLSIPTFFILQNKGGRAFLLLAFSLSILVTLFWLFPFIFTAKFSLLGIFYGTERLLDFKNFLYDNLVSFVLPPFMWFTAFFYFKNLKKINKQQLRREIIFYSIPLIVSFLYMTRIILFIPIIKRPYPDSYHMLFIFFSIFFLVKTPLNSYNNFFKNIIKLFIFAAPILFIVLSFAVIPNFRTNNEIDKEVISLLPNINVNDRFLIEKMPYPTSSYAFYSYAAVYYNLSTPSGWLNEGASEEYHKKLESITQDVQEKNCERLLKNLRAFNTTKLVTYRDYCIGMQDCGMKLLIKKENVCLLDVP